MKQTLKIAQLTTTANRGCLCHARYPSLRFARVDALATPQAVVAIVNDLLARYSAVSGEAATASVSTAASCADVSSDTATSSSVAAPSAPRPAESPIAAGTSPISTTCASEVATSASDADFIETTTRGCDKVAGACERPAVTYSLTTRPTTSATMCPSLVVFVDIGGNRELEALVALLSWVATALPVRHACLPACYTRCHADDAMALASQSPIPKSSWGGRRASFVISTQHHTRCLCGTFVHLCSRQRHRLSRCFHDTSDTHHVVTFVRALVKLTHLCGCFFATPDVTFVSGCATTRRGEKRVAVPSMFIAGRGLHVGGPSVPRVRGCS
jgi:hypothetical protein